MAPEWARNAAAGIICQLCPSSPQTIRATRPGATRATKKGDLRLGVLRGVVGGVAVGLGRHADAVMSFARREA